MASKVKSSFKPDGKDLQKILYFYGISFDDTILCPFHNDNNPSMHLMYEEGLFHCFACNASGNAFDFVRLANKDLSDLEKLIRYFKILNSSKVSKAKINKVATISKKKKERNKKQELLEAKDFYYGLKTVNWRDPKEIGIDKVKDYMMERGFNSKALTLAKAKLTYTDNNYPIVFPIFDNGDFKGFVCRATNKLIKDRKYLYNKGFSRNSTLGGNYKSEVVVICEGFMDALKLRQFGLKYVVAIFGWKITTEQINKLKQAGVKTVINALDLDEPGQEGAAYIRRFFNVVDFQFPKDSNINDPGDLNEEQFKISYNKTKRLYRRNRRN